MVIFILKQPSFNQNLDRQGKQNTTLFLLVSYRESLGGTMATWSRFILNVTSMGKLNTNGRNGEIESTQNRFSWFPKEWKSFTIICWPSIKADSDDVPSTKGPHRPTPMQPEHRHEYILWNLEIEKIKLSETDRHNISLMIVTCVCLKKGLLFLFFHWWNEINKRTRREAEYQWFATTHSESVRCCQYTQEIFLCSRQRATRWPEGGGSVYPHTARWWINRFTAVWSCL